MNFLVTTLTGALLLMFYLVSVFGDKAAPEPAAAPGPEIVFNISSGDKLPGFMLAQLQGLDEAALLLSTPGGREVDGPATLLTDYQFSEAGTYTARFTRVRCPIAMLEVQGHVCDHYALPAQITVMASAGRIEYLTETLTFSEPIVGGQATEHITVTIQAIINGDQVAIPTSFYSSGIETTITGHLNPQQAVLSAGTHTLQYQLQGMGKPGTYIQFNFQDANGHDVPCGITTPL
jgi:hypothetical protein